MLLGQGLFEASFEFVTIKFRNDLFYSWLVDHLQVIDSHVWYMAVSDFGPYFALACFYSRGILQTFHVHF